MIIRKYCLSVSYSLGLLVLAVLPACSASEQGVETATPAAVNSDADRRAIYNSGGRSSAVPDATPNRMRLGEQAADINRYKRPETLNTDAPNTSTPKTRFERLETDAQPDTTRFRP